MSQVRYTNNAGINLAVAVWLAYDDYDYVDDPNYYSVTTLNKSIRQIVLGKRLPREQRLVDVLSLVQSRFGQALHSGIENAWKNHYMTSLAALGMPKRAIEAVRVNPTDGPSPDHIDVHTEVRNEIVIDGFRVGGKFDLCIEGRLQDVKKTSVWGYQRLKGISDEKWVAQGSLYRLINPTIVTHDDMFIQYLLLDWNQGAQRREPAYPPHPVPHRVVRLWDTATTLAWVRKRLAEIKYHLAQPDDSQLPLCSDEELWRSEPRYKYYANSDAPAGSRSTKNFDDHGSAMLHLNQKGKGRVDVVPGLVKACGYCECAPICSQRMMLEAAGDYEP